MTTRQLVKKILGKQKVRLGLFVAIAPLEAVFILTQKIFNATWYLSQHPSHEFLRGKSTYVVALHYVLKGRRRGFSPSPFFIPEYFDARNWHNSIIDPLTRYMLQKKNWQQPTSIIFVPRENGSFLRSPLARYIGSLKKEQKININGFEEVNSTWNVVEAKIKKEQTKYYAQESLRYRSAPSRNFDYKLERKTISQFSSYSSPPGREPEVSIIMPVWNRARIVGAAIQSVLAQTFSNWELIIVDDGSSDGTQDVLEEFVATDSRIKIIKPGHQGVCGARNSGIKNATGRFIAFLDSDNEWRAEYLQTMIGSMTALGANAAYAAIKMNSSRRVRYRTTSPNKDLFAIGNYVDLNAFIVNHAALKKIGYFDGSLRRMVDYDLVCRIAAKEELTYVPIIGVEYSDHADLDRITTRELTSWDGVVKSKNFINWNESRTRSKGVSIIIPIKNDIKSVLRCVQSIIIASPGNDIIEIIIADSSSSAALNTTMSLLGVVDSRIRYVRFPASHDNTLGSNYGYSVANGSRLIFIDQRTIVERDFFEKLSTAKWTKNTLLGAVTLKGNRTLFSAGISIPKIIKAPVYNLEGHGLGDAYRLPDLFEVDALAHGVVLITSDLFKRLKGLNPLYDMGFEFADFSLRAKSLGYTSPHIMKNIEIVNVHDSKGWGSKSLELFMKEHCGNGTDTDIWSMVGLKITDWHEQGGGHHVALSEVVDQRKLHKQHKYRWAIKISAPSDERRFAWGDLHYAESLASSLRKMGQVVTVDYRESHYRSTTGLDDVNLDLRGLDNYKPDPSKTNILWLISHPEKVNQNIVRQFSKVYAAGLRWAEYMTQQGAPVEFLPQATDTSRFRPLEDSKVNKLYKDEVVFVGNTRGVKRKIVSDIITAGVRPKIIGNGWEGFVPDDCIIGSYVANSQLSDIYGSALIVLNDHWDDMRRWGFVSNRIYDAVATGAKVITDKVGGLDDLPSDHVREYESTTELNEILSSPWAKSTKSYSQRIQANNAIDQKHSFDARAKKLINDVNSLIC